MATRQQVAEAVDADILSYNRFMTVEDAIEAGDERPGMDLIRERQEAWKRFWNRRGTNPIGVNPALAD